VSRVEVADLAYRFPGGEPVLEDITFAVEAGRKLAILGANGAGKSTLLLHMNGLLLPDHGSVAIGDLVVRDDTLRDIRRRVGLVFQDPDDQLFLPTLLEDVAFGPLNDGADPHDAETTARALLDSLGLGHAADRAAHHLSGGERRLAAMATVLVTHPEVLVLDEPTAGLDARARRRVVQRLDRRPETLLLATHDLEVARVLCDSAIVLDNGHLAAAAPIDAILDDDELLLRHGLHAPLIAPEPHDPGASPPEPDPRPSPPA
jgi:cobalt/nickel transport system ATP-binding protein